MNKQKVVDSLIIAFCIMSIARSCLSILMTIETQRLLASTKAEMMVRGYPLGR